MIMGISAGTRSIGTAIIENGTLIDWGVKMFKEEWSDRKLERILTVIEAHITNYRIKSIAIKRLDISRTSKKAEQVIDEIKLLAKRLNINCKAYHIEELKHLCNGAVNKESLTSYVFQQYPEVEKNTRLTKTNYHIKTIEAVALAHVLN